jgi:hypothetical protein
MERLTMDKRSCLFCLIVSDEEKSFCNIDSRIDTTLKRVPKKEEASPEEVPAPKEETKPREKPKVKKTQQAIPKVKPGASLITLFSLSLRLQTYKLVPGKLPHRILTNRFFICIGFSHVCKY